MEQFQFHTAKFTEFRTPKCDIELYELIRSDLYNENCYLKIKVM